MSRRLRLLVLLLLAVVGIYGGVLYRRDTAARRDLQFVRALGPGWNLGNSLDVHDLHFDTDQPQDYETYWGNPPVTRELIEEIYGAGFRTLRIPVTWYEHMDEENQVDAAWINRVQEVVDYGIDTGMVVILNAHHDPWYTPDDAHLPEAKVKTQALWSQIAARFAQYDERLLFEAMNEPRLMDTQWEWGVGTPRAQEIVAELGEVFVDTVRAAGGGNQSRYLLLPSYCARIETAALEGVRLPKGQRLILSVHLYAPYAFAQQDGGTKGFDPQNPADTRELDQAFADLERLFTRKRIPVVVTEFGAVDKGNEQERAQWAGYILQRADTLGIPCVWWDAGGEEGRAHSYALYSRHSRRWQFPDLVATLVNMGRSTRS